MTPRAVGCCCALLTGLLAAGLARAQPIAAAEPAEAANDPTDPADPSTSIERPRSAGRVVRLFDFEEARTNPFPVPRFWRRAQGDAAGVTGAPRPGFPLWNQAALDYRIAARGQGSLRLAVNGGSACLRLEPGVLPIFPSADYTVSAMIRTDGVEHSRARLVVRFLDNANRPIPGSEAAGDFVGRTDGWTPVTVQAPGDFEHAAYLQVDLELLQPARFREPTLGAHQVFPEDFAAAAWFDDVTVAQLPRITLSTQTPANVVVHPLEPELRLGVRDLAGESLRARTTVYDLDGRVVDADERAVGMGLAAWTWTPRVEALGWYRASLEVLSGPTRVGTASVDFVWLPPEPRAGRALSADRARFGLVLERPPQGRQADTIALADRSGVGTLTLPVWHADLTARTAAAEVQHLLPLVEHAMRRGTRMGFTLSRVPSTLVAELHVAPDDPLAVFTHPESAWGPYLLAFLDKYGQSVQHWQIGLPGGPATPRWSAVAVNLDRAEKVLASLVPGPVVSVPWPAEAAIDRAALAAPGAPDAIAAAIGPWVPADSVGALTAAWHEPPSPADLRVVFGTLPIDQFSRRDAAIDLVRRTIEFWRYAGAPAGRPMPELAIAQPWSWVGGPRGQAAPHSEYAAWRSLIDRLSGRRVVGDVPIAPGVRCVILAPTVIGREAPSGGSAVGGASGGLLIAWREWADPEAAEIRSFLGDGTITAYDLFGNATVIEPATIPAPGGGPGTRSHVIPLGDAPVFIEGVDAALAHFTASLRLEPGFAASSAAEHEHEILLDNPWPEPISGRLRIVEPGGFSSGIERDRSWKISPRQIPFALAAGQTARLPIVMSFSPVEEAGPKPFIVDVDLDGRPEYGRIRLRSSFEVGLNALRVDLTYRFTPTPAGPNVVVEAQVANNGNSPVTLELTAFAPPEAGFPRARASVSDLAAGESIVRRFSFPNGAATLRGRSVLVAVQDTVSNARVNRSVLIE